MEKKKKIFYLDFIRVISMIMIVTYHFYAHFAENNITGFKIFSNGKWGMIGVTLFFMISGASLIYNYGENLDIKKYAKKRFLGIFLHELAHAISGYTDETRGFERTLTDLLGLLASELL